LTVAAVPTGMKIGVCTGPWANSIVAARALEFGSVASRVNFMNSYLWQSFRSKIAEAKGNRFIRNSPYPELSVN
jgi:hypothetical protein